MFFFSLRFLRPSRFLRFPPGFCASLQVSALRLKYRTERHLGEGLFSLLGESAGAALFYEDFLAVDDVETGGKGLD